MGISSPIASGFTYGVEIKKKLLFQYRGSFYSQSDLMSGNNYYSIFENSVLVGYGYESNYLDLSSSLGTSYISRHEDKYFGLTTDFKLLIGYKHLFMGPYFFQYNWQFKVFKIFGCGPNI